MWNYIIILLQYVQTSQFFLRLEFSSSPLKLLINNIGKPSVFTIESYNSDESNNILFKIIIHSGRSCWIKNLNQVPNRRTLSPGIEEVNRLTITN